MHAVSPSSYDRIIVAFSGGKDSVGCVLHLLDLGVPKALIELWHQDVDGGGESFMDWPVTRGYCQAFADALGLTIRFQHKEGGFLREMLRENSLTAPTMIGDGQTVGGTRGKLSTRRMFPQVSADLSVRWCSAYLKIDVASMSIRNDPRFMDCRTLYVSGERAEESSARAKYLEFEPHRAHGGRRHIDHWRPVLRWSEVQIWEALKAHRINPHPCYWLGYGRASCRYCIFGDDNQWATGRELSPPHFQRIAGLEAEFGKTIHRTLTVTERADRGTSYITPAMKDMVTVANSETYTLPILVDDWQYPPGAFKHCGGPT